MRIWGYDGAVALPEMSKPPLYTARLAAAEIDDGSWAGRGRDRALVQLARFWRAWPSRRESMVAEAPAPDTDPTTFAKVAAVVHFLCLHDHIAVPAWTQGHKADPEVMLFGIPLDSRYGQRMQQTAPAVCAAYGVYFTWNLLDLWRGPWTLAAEPEETSNPVIQHRGIQTGVDVSKHPASD